MPKIQEPSGWMGKWQLIISDSEGNVIERTGLKPNLIMDVGLDMLRDFINGTVSDGEIKYVALGSGTTTPAAAQTALDTEEFRKAVTTQTVMAGAGALETLLYVSEAEGNSFKTEEIGWFAGASANGTANTGVMIARILYSRQKTALETWTIVRVDTFNRV